MKKHALTFFLLIGLTSCAALEKRPLSYLQYIKRPVSYAGMVIGSVESPLVLSLSQAPFPGPYTRLNKPLHPDVCAALAQADQHWLNRGDQPTTNSLIQTREAVFASQALLDLRKHGETYDTFNDLADKDTIVLVALSGGGLRASRLAAHALRQLEENYVQTAQDYLESPLPMHEQIDAFSSVSGGSIYSALVARQYANNLTSLLPRTVFDPIERRLRELPFVPDAADERSTRFFSELEQSPTARWRTRSLGVYSLFSYLTPFTIPLYFLTDYGYTHHLAITLDLYPDLLPLTFTFEDLPRFAPRFFFIATDSETGAPFVFTQSIVHLPSEQVLEIPTAQEGLLEKTYAPAEENKRIYPLFNALTLEDTNSSPAHFPVSLAAMTSAAFPGLLNQVPISTYGYNAEKKDVYRTKASLNLFDGGVYDNSGLTILADFVEYLTLNQPKDNPRPKTVLLLSINAEITRFDPNRYKREALQEAEPKKSRFDVFKVAMPWPFSALAGGFTGATQVHFLNKRRAEEMAVGRLRALERNEQIKFYYFPVNLAEIEWADPKVDRPVTFESVQKISTAMALRSDEDRLLETAARYLLSKERQGFEALELDESAADKPSIDTRRAWAMALIRSQLDQWQGPPQKIVREE